MKKNETQSYVGEITSFFEKLKGLCTGRILGKGCTINSKRFYPVNNMQETLRPVVKESFFVP